MQQGKKRMRQGVFVAIWAPILAVLLAAAIVVTVVTDMYAKPIDFALGGGEMVVTKAEGTEDWEDDYYGAIAEEEEEQLYKDANELTERIAGEGFVLLKNEGNALPLDTSSEEKNISAFGWSFTHPVYGGTGSGNVKTDTAVTPQMGLESAGFTVNPTLLAAYDEWSKSNSYTNAVNTVGNNTTTALMSAFGLQSRVSISCDERPTVIYGYGNWDIIEAPASALDMEQARGYADVALVMIGRQGGEQGDLPTNMGDDTFYNRGDGIKYGYNPDKHYLELTDEEEALIAAVKAEDFEKIVVVVNSANPMELGGLQSDEDIDAIILAPGPGQTGFNALGDILSGEVNPSGKTVDIFAADFTKDPTFVNFADPKNYAYEAAAMQNAASGKRNGYNNITKENSYDSGFFVQYEEGIYVGYRYYETAADIGKEGFVYEDEVVYPFGYGLSYTSFEQEIVSSSLSGYTKTVEVRVKNTGEAAGKSAVQLYVEAPYTDYDIANGVEKSTVSLVAFGKTGELASGAEEIVTLTFTQDDLTSYDDANAKAYILDEGDYVFTLRSDSHNVVEYDGEAQELTWNNPDMKIYNEENDGARQSEMDAQDRVYDGNYAAATNAFDDSLIAEEMAKMNMLTRSDKFATMPDEPTEADRTASATMVEAAAKYAVAEHNDEADKMPATGAQNGLSLIDMRGLDYDDEAWELLLDQLSVDEMEELVTKSGFGTPQVDSVGLPQVLANDGPASISVNWAGVEGSVEATTNAYTCEVTLACTWNTQLAEEMGVMLGREALMIRNHSNNMPQAGWYAPGVNLHRSPFGGRNFEYYSEDALLSGKMASATISGTSSKGLYAMMKHFALNDQETYRSGWGYASNNALFTWADEQTIREVYLKAFEIPVKEATCEIKYIADQNGTVETKTIRAALGVMSSYNAIGSTWAGGNDGLLNKVLRSEWGFDGVVITDYRSPQLYMDADMAIRAGGDVMLCTTPLELADTSSATAVASMREAAHHLLYATVNSNAMNGLVPGTIVSYTMAPWRILVISIDVVIGVFVAAWVVMMVLRGVDAKKHPENYKSKKQKSAN